MGLTFAASNSKFSQGSSFFDDKQWLLKKIRNKIQNVPTDLTFFEIDNFLVAIDKKATDTEFRSILAIQTDSSKISLNSQIILAIIGLLTCLLIKIFAEKIFLGRGPDVSLKQMVAATFLILILIPLSSSVFLSHLFVSNQLKKERILNKEKLFNKVNNLDKQTEFSLKETLNLIRSLNSIEKIASFTGLSPDNSFYELSLALANKFPRRREGNIFSELAVYEKGKSYFQFTEDDSSQKKFVPQNKADYSKDLLLPRFVELMEDSGFKLKKKRKAGLDPEQLKKEMFNDILLGLTGEKTYYATQDLSQAIIALDIFNETNLTFGFPVYKKGKPIGIYMYVMGVHAINRHCPTETNLATGSEPLIICDGKHSRFKTLPIFIDEVKEKYPQLYKSALQAHTTKKKVTFQDLQTKGQPIILSQPAKTTNYTICGQIPTRTRNEIEQMQMKTAINILGATTILGLLFSTFGILYFLQPVQSLDKGAREIIKENYKVRMVENHPDEFASISYNFNQLARALDEGSLLKQFLPDSLKNQISNSSDTTVEKSGKLTQASIIFSGIDGFKKILAKDDIKAIHELLQIHLEAAVAATNKYGGEVEKMIEDKIMIVFEHSNQTENEFAIEPAQIATFIKKEIHKKAGMEAVIGINSGTVVSGIMGASEVRLAKTVIGDPVNLAARLAAMAVEHSKSKIVVSDSYRKLLPQEYKTQKLPFDTVKGKTQTIEAFELL